MSLLLTTSTCSALFSDADLPVSHRDEYAFSQTSRLWWSRYDMELASSLQLQNGSHTLDVAADLSLAHAQKPASASSAVRLRWDKRAHLWDSNVALDTPFIVFNNNITSNGESWAAMLHARCTGRRVHVSPPVLYAGSGAMFASLLLCLCHYL